MLTKQKRDSKPKSKLVAKPVPALRMLFATQFDHTINTLMRVLSPRSRSMMCRRFGLFGLEPHTLDAIGQQEGLTRERIRQIEDASVLAMHKQFTTGKTSWRSMSTGVRPAMRAPVTSA